jgi:hypothetical protein
MVLRKVPALALLAACALSAGRVGADAEPPGPPAPPPGAGPQYPPGPRGPESPTEQLLGPIALYPDPLLAVILPAATAPADIAAAATYLVRYGDPSRIDSQRWDPSVRALAHYPAVLSWMAQNVAWTEAVGRAFLSSPAQVMAAIQSLRARALAAGVLKDTPQQRVVIEDNAIQILPAQPDSIYAPAYDTDVVYSETPYYDYGGPFINFGAALPVGGWLSYCFDWANPALWVGAWGAWHGGGGGWRPPHPAKGHLAPGGGPWQPPVRTPGGPQPRGHPVAALPLPAPLAGAPHPPPARYRSPAVQVVAEPTSAVVPAPKTAPPQADRPRLAPSAYVAPPSAAETAPRYGSAEGTSRDRDSGSGPANPPSARAAAGPAAAGAPSIGSSPAASTRPAPEVFREAAPAPAHASAPPPAPAAAAPAASPAAAPSGETRNH